MINIFFLGFFLLSGAHAQSLESLLGQNKPTDIKVRWSCPQHKYPQIRQLRESADVRVRFVERNGVLTTEFKPDIFKVNPLSLNNAITTITGQAQMTVDYAHCIENFKKSLSVAVEVKRESDLCRNYPSSSLCERGLEELNDSSQDKIEKSPYLINRQTHKKLPRSLPLEATGLEADEVNQILQKFRRGQEVKEKDLFSKEVYDIIAQRTGYLTQEQLEKYDSAFKQYRLNLQSQLCDGSSPLCEHIRQTLSQAESTIEATSKRQIENLKNYRDSSLTSLQAPLDEKEATEQLKNIFSTKPFDCNFMNQQFQSGARMFSATNFPEALANNMDLFAEVADSECVAKTLQSISVTMNYRPELSKDFVRNCEKDWTQGCVVGLKRKEIMESNLRKLWSLNFGTKGEDYIDENGGISCTIEMSSPNKTISEILADHRKTLACLELKPGETKPVNFRDGAPSGISGEYVLKKKNNGDHEVIVNIDITSDNYGVTRDQMHSRIQSCMKDTSPFMAGPDGKKLDFTILTPAESLKRPVNERPGISRVSIQAPGTRSNSMSYKSDIDCPTIAHEVLHLLGLCDEYNGNGDGYTCRAVAKTASIMSNQNEAFRLGMSKTHTCECRPGSICERVQASTDPALKKFYLQPSAFTIISYELRNKYCTYQDIPDGNWNTLAEKQTAIIAQQTATSITIHSQNITDYNWPRIGRSQFKCSCANPDDAECLKSIETMKEQILDIDNINMENCPSGSFSKKEEIGEKIDQPAIWSDKGLQFVQKARLPSLLHPNHYERIVGGTCASKAKKYNECAVWAYRNKEQTNNCADRPAHCENGKEFLGLQP